MGMCFLAICVCLVDDGGLEELENGVNKRSQPAAKRRGRSQALAFSEWHVNAVRFQSLAMLQV